MDYVEILEGEIKKDNAISIIKPSIDGKTFWLSKCKDFGIIEVNDDCFEAYFRLYSTLANHDHTWFNNYSGAIRYLKREHHMDSRMKRISKEDFEKAIPLK